MRAFACALSAVIAAIVFCFAVGQWRKMPFYWEHINPEGRQRLSLQGEHIYGPAPTELPEKTTRDRWVIVGTSLTILAFSLLGFVRFSRKSEAEQAIPGSPLPPAGS